MTINPWDKLVSCGTTADFIVTLNVTRNGFFGKLLPLFIEEQEKANFGSPFRTESKTRGRKPLLTSAGLLGLILWYLKSRDCMYLICMAFEVVPSTASVWLNNASSVLLKAVQRVDLVKCRVPWPSVEEMETSTHSLQRNREFGPLLPGVFAVIDGGRMPVVKYEDDDLQNGYWEGFTQSHEDTNIFAFSFMGALIHGAINFPGAWHDSKVSVASGLYHPKLSDAMTPPGYGILGGTEFPRVCAGLTGKIVRGRKSNELSTTRSGDTST